jgi:tRNA pseudouridine38-40 synthase
MDEITPQYTAATRRLRFTVAYDGTPWQGWQGQPNGLGVQNQIEKALAAVTQEPVSVQAAGRTDTGVHALCQTAHCDVPAKLAISPERWVRAINGGLHPSIRILSCEETTPDFHARFSAQAKIYRYRIHRSEIMPPLKANRAWHVRGPVNLDLLSTCLELVKGTHNFARLSANRGFVGEAKLRAIPANTTRTIHSAEFT